MTFSEILYTISTWGLPLILGVIVHEVAHGYMSYLLGDNTAKEEGRLTLNPLAHMDWMGSVIMPSSLIFFSAPFLVGWAKPVPVDYGALKSPRRDLFLIALAGPLANFLLAILLIILGNQSKEYIDPVSQTGMWIEFNVHNGVIFSLVLAAFNLLPILPLDGGKMLLVLLPKRIAAMYQRSEPFGLIILLSIIFVMPQMIGVNFVHWFITTVFPPLYRLVNIITG